MSGRRGWRSGCGSWGSIRNKSKGGAPREGTSMNARQKALVAAPLGSLFLLSLCLPAVGDGASTMSGWQCCFEFPRTLLTHPAFLSPSQWWWFGLGWLPNPLFSLGLFLVISGQPWRVGLAALTGLLATAGALLLLETGRMLGLTTAVIHLSNLRVGYFVWLGVMCLLALTALGRLTRLLTPAEEIDTPLKLAVTGQPPTAPPPPRTTPR
jgi:hypothetical protein